MIVQCADTIIAGLTQRWTDEGPIQQAAQQLVWDLGGYQTLNGLSPVAVNLILTCLIAKRLAERGIL